MLFLDDKSPVCVMMSPKMYERILEEIADLSPAHSDPSPWISEEEMCKRFNITEHDLKDFESVDLE